MASHTAKCGHPASKPNLTYCRDCWRKRGPELPEDERKHYASVCGHETYNSGRKYCAKCYHTRGLRNADTIDEDRARQRTLGEQTSLKKKYDEALRTIERQEREIAALDAIGKGIDTYAITPTKREGQSEGTAVWVASDWHVEERVGAEVGSLNRHDLSIARSRAAQFFTNSARLTSLLARDIPIKTVTLALLGDFISGDIHDEVAEVAEVAPMLAVIEAQNMIASGIEYVLKASDWSFVIPCHSGNHARTTKTTRFARENGHSLEYLMYLHLAAYFRHEPRVRFLVPEGMHSYLEVYDQTIRFQHGHAIKYNGGVGGIYIPTNKAIAQWNKARRADLDVFGHFHQLRDGGNFICNGSQIGYNAFALSIKADYEPPKQALFLMDKKRGRTCTWPVLYDALGKRQERAA